MKRLGLDERTVLRLIPNSDTKRINRVYYENYEVFRKTG